MLMIVIRVPDLVACALGGTLRSWASSAILLSAVTALIAGQAALASGADVRPIPAFCRSAGAVFAQSVPAQISLRSCPMKGRLIVLRLPNGRIGPGLHIPGPGHEVGAAGLTTSGGDYALSVLNCNLRRHLGGGDWSGMASLYP